MNQEYEPRHRFTPEDRRDATREPYVGEVIANAPTPQAGQAIAEAYAKYGTAFAEFLTFPDTAQYGAYESGEAPDAATTLRRIEADFRNVYYGSFPNREALIDDTIESFDWGFELDRALRDLPDLRAMVTFDRDAIWGFISDHYEVIARDDCLYVFEP